MLLVEGALTAISVGLAFCWPHLGASFFSSIERTFGRLAARKRLAVAVVGFSALLTRLAMLPYFPIPHPFIPDDYSFLLAADTFASGRLTNPTPAMWTHFESINISMQPTYGSMFFPAFGMVLAAGKVLTGNPWFGLLLVTTLMCAAICWMLQAWLPPGWALLGGLLAVVRLGLFSFWINTYTGAGSVAALGGALVLGALPRILKHARVRDSLLLATGVLVLANSRPYEGLLLCLPVAVVLTRWIFWGKNGPAGAVLLRLAVPGLALLIAGGSWMAYYNYRNFGSPLTLPYTTNRATYAVAQHFIWERELPEPVYRYKAMRDYYMLGELPEFRRFHTIPGFISQSIGKLVVAFVFFAGMVFAPLLIVLPRALEDRRIRFLSLCMIPMFVGVIAEAGIRPYYLAPFTAAFYAIGLQAMRHLRQAKSNRQRVGRTMVRLMATVCICLAAVDLWADSHGFQFSDGPGSTWNCECLGPNRSGTQRANVLSELERLPGKQLVLVRYAAKHGWLNEWVYNNADIDDSKVIWAREMDSGDNSELIRYYKDRQVWLVQADQVPAKLLPYSGPAQTAADTH